MKRMSGSDVYYRPIELSDYLHFYPDTALPNTIKGIAFVKNNSVIGIAGIQYNGYYFIVFSDINNNINIDRQTIWRGTLVVMDLIKNMKCDVYAIADESRQTSGRFLERLGFFDVGGIYKRSSS